jgi:hypothetical protein
MLSSRRLQNTAALPEARAGSESAPLEEVVRLIREYVRTPADAAAGGVRVSRPRIQVYYGTPLFP